MDPKSTEPGTGFELRVEINSDSKLCHDPEGGVLDQSLVGDN